MVLLPVWVCGGMETGWLCVFHSEMSQVFSTCYEASVLTTPTAESLGSSGGFDPRPVFHLSDVLEQQKASILPVVSILHFAFMNIFAVSCAKPPLAASEARVIEFSFARCCLQRAARAFTGRLRRRAGRAGARATAGLLRADGELHAATARLLALTAPGGVGQPWGLFVHV